ncbi:hypothetical protein [Pontibacter litorisediminis]|uniref:hypothetical protein n=1 Tax=Pontibacter litorisediminis TaxID=1846260 RepID=UPI0023EDD2D1|nr:hypothetical protein [Pontibacter litorisediminis]
MKKLPLCFLSGAVILSGCSEPAEGLLEPSAVRVDAVADAPVATEPDAEFTGEETQTYYIIVSGEGYDYDALAERASGVADFLQVSFDQQGRIYEKGKGIIVPYDDEDEMYRGLYYPRRFEGSEVSIERCDYYASEDAVPDTTKMMVVAGMFEAPEKAKAVLQKLKPHLPETKLIERDVYVGCLH